MCNSDLGYKKNNNTIFNVKRVEATYLPKRKNNFFEEFNAFLPYILCPRKYKILQLFLIALKLQCTHT